MAYFAMHDGKRVVNAVVADDAAVAEQVTGLSAVEVVDGQPWIDWTLQDGVWVAPSQPEPVIDESLSTDESTEEPA